MNKLDINFKVKATDFDTEKPYSPRRRRAAYFWREIWNKLEDFDKISLLPMFMESKSKYSSGWYREMLMEVANYKEHEKEYTEMTVDIINNWDDYLEYKEKENEN